MSSLMEAKSNFIYGTPKTRNTGTAICNVFYIHCLCLISLFCYRTIGTSPYVATDMFVICIDLTSRSNFEDLNKWFQEVERYSKAGGGKLLLGMKADLVEARVISLEEIQSACHAQDIEYIEVSSKTGHNIKELLDAVGMAAKIQWLEHAAAPAPAAPPA